MRVIPLTQGFVAWIDDEDYEALATRRWHTQASKNGQAHYAARCDYVKAAPGGRPKYVLEMMHRTILGPPPGFEVDHRVHLPQLRAIDNRRSNLRLVTRPQNSIGQRKRLAATSSVFKGVSRGRAGKWIAQLRRSLVSTNPYIGVYDDEIRAALAYDRAAMASYGEYARCNFIGPNAIYASLPLSPSADLAPPEAW